MQYTTAVLRKEEGTAARAGMVTAPYCQRQWTI